MDRLTNNLKIANRPVFIVIALVSLLYCDLADAAFASKFSFTAGELYTDNLFFTKDKEHDFVTTLTPTLSLLYAPAGQNIPTLNINISPSGVLFARHSEFNNFGENWSLNGGYSYPYSPKLNFHVSDVISRQGQYRLGPLTQGAFQAPNLPTAPPPTGGTVSGQGNQNLSNFNSGGATVSNDFYLGGSYLYRPHVSFTANYRNILSRYLDQGGTDLYQTFEVRGVYNWRKDHNLHAGYTMSIYNTRNNGTSVLHNFDFGDDYFSEFLIQLSPTLSLSGSTGLTINTGTSGPTVANNSRVSLTKIWQQAQLTATVQHGLTPTYGAGDIAETTSFSANFNMQLSERLNVLASLNFPIYSADSGDFKTLNATLGARYQFNSWLASNLIYNYRSSDSSSKAASNSDGILQAGLIRANSVYLTLTASFDIWPNVGLARDFTSTSLTPMIRTPFPSAASAASSTSGAPSSSSKPAGGQ